jgi:hypothetical protein
MLPGALQTTGNRKTYYRTAFTTPDLIRSSIFPTFTWPWEVSGSSDATQPVNDAYSDYVTALWRKGQPAEIGSIQERHRLIHRQHTDWTSPWQWNEGQLEAGNPAMTRNTGVWREEFTPGVGNIACRFQGQLHANRLTSTFEDQLYPQADVRPATAQGGHTILRVIWAQRRSAGVYPIYFFPYVFSSSHPFYDIVCGQENPSPYCVYRDGAMALDAYSIDYAQSSLVYRLSYLNPLYRYRVHATVYHQGSVPLLEEFKFPVDSTTALPGTIVTAPPGEPVEVWLDIPPQLFRDAVTDLVISRLQGDYAAVASIELQEYDSAGPGSGGQAAGQAPLPHPPALLGVAPNPFTRATSVEYQLFSTGPVSLEILDVLGRRVRVIKTPELGLGRPGIHTAFWDGLDDRNRVLPNGIYFCRLQAGDFTGTRKMVKLE